MAKMSPGVTRTVAVLNFFADHPGRAFTLTDIVRALKFSRATCHALLAALVDANYLFRTSDKSYTLGPALARIAKVAQKHLAPLQVAAGEMRTLADEMDVVCSAVFQDRGEAVVRERASSVSHLGWTNHLGKRLPMTPPFGSVFFAWSKPTEIERWIGRMDPAPDAALRQHILNSLEFPRGFGFCMGIRKEHIRNLEHAQSLILQVDKTDYLIRDLDLEAHYDLAFVCAPVFDAEGGVLFALSIAGFVESVTGEQVLAIGRRVRESCDKITSFLGGAVPGLTPTGAVA
jgi:DNA-binding IclR family transcriptional regulator